MKNTIVIVAAGLLVLVGLFVALNTFIYNEKQGGEENLDGTEVELTGTVTGVDMSGIMVDGPALVTFVTEIGEEHVIAIPSMGINLCAAKDEIASPSDLTPGDRIEVKGILNIEAQIVPCDDASHYLRAESVVEDAAVGISFTYPKGPNGYVQSEVPAASQDPSFGAAYMLMTTSDHLELQNAEGPREGPPTIMIRAYKNTDKLWPAVWAERNAGESNIQTAFGEPEETVIGGANAIRYTADGLYAMDTVVVAHGSHVYVLTGSYIDRDSMIHDDFEALLKTIAFIPEGV